MPVRARPDGPPARVRRRPPGSRALPRADGPRLPPQRRRLLRDGLPGLPPLRAAARARRRLPAESQPAAHPAPQRRRSRRARPPALPRRDVRALPPLPAAPAPRITRRRVRRTLPRRALRRGRRQPRGALPARRPARRGQPARRVPPIVVVRLPLLRPGRAPSAHRGAVRAARDRARARTRRALLLPRLLDRRRAYVALQGGVPSLCSDAPRRLETRRLLQRPGRANAPGANVPN